jgi:RNA polymerase sigma-70 factor (sigma-E family)
MTKAVGLVGGGDGAIPIRRSSAPHEPPTGASADVDTSDQAEAGGASGAGTADAFEALYRARYGEMVRIAHVLTGSNALAEEVVQDAFLALYPRFERIADPAGYLYRSVVNGCRTSFRRRKVRERIQPLRSVPDVPAPELDETWSALARLSDKRRAVVVLRFYADMPLTQIGEVLGCSVGTVKSQLHRALAQLKDVIEP